MLTPLGECGGCLPACLPSILYTTCWQLNNMARPVDGVPEWTSLRHYCARPHLADGDGRLELRGGGHVFTNANAPFEGDVLQCSMYRRLYCTVCLCGRTSKSGIGALLVGCCNPNQPPAISKAVGSVLAAHCSCTLLPSQSTPQNPSNMPQNLSFQYAEVSASKSVVQLSTCQTLC